MLSIILLSCQVLTTWKRTTKESIASRVFCCRHFSCRRIKNANQLEKLQNENMSLISMESFKIFVLRSDTVFAPYFHWWGTVQLLQQLCLLSGSANSSHFILHITWDSTKYPAKVMDCGTVCQGTKSPQRWVLGGDTGVTEYFGTRIGGHLRRRCGLVAKSPDYGTGFWAIGPRVRVPATSPLSVRHATADWGYNIIVVTRNEAEPAP